EPATKHVHAADASADHRVIVLAEARRRAAIGGLGGGGVVVLEAVERAAGLHGRIDIRGRERKPRQAERVGRVRLLRGDHAAARPLAATVRTRERHGAHDAIAIHDGAPHVEIETAVAGVARGSERGFERIVARQAGAGAEAVGVRTIEVGIAGEGDACRGAGERGEDGDEISGCRTGHSEMLLVLRARARVTTTPAGTCASRAQIGSREGRGCEKIPAGREYGQRRETKEGADMKNSIAAALLMALMAPVAWAENRTTTGEVLIEPPTLMALGLEWPIEGDDNRNAHVAMSYRKKGAEKWSRALDPLRIQNEEVYARGALDWKAPNMFSGSVLDLDEDTDYEVKLTLTDADGVTGATEKTVTGHTRAEPRPAKGGRVFHVYPPGYTGPKQQPAFSGLLEAYYMGSLGGDWSRASPPRAKAGDTILVHAGVYLSKHDHYSHEINSRFTTCCGTPWDGTYYLTQKGTPDKPIAIVGAGDGEAIFDGDNNTVLFNLMGGDYQYFEGITIRNTGTAIEAGMKGIAGSKGLTVKHVKFENLGTAVHSDYSGSSGFYIADNDMLGRESLDYVFTWYGIKPWVDRPDFNEKGKLKSFYAVSIYGQGHIMAYNRVRGFH